MDYSLLADMEEKKGGDMERCKTAVLHTWLQSGTATKSSLLEALATMGRDDLAAKVV